MKKYLLALSLIVVIALAVGYSVSTNVVNGSVADNGLYNYTNITTGSSTNFTTIKVGHGVLGSIIVSSTTNAATFKVYDGVSGTTTASSTIITILPKSAVAGTYTFDLSVDKGIIVEPMVGFAGDYVVTWR